MFNACHKTHVQPACTYLDRTVCQCRPGAEVSMLNAMRLRNLSLRLSATCLAAGRHGKGHLELELLDSNSDQPIRVAARSAGSSIDHSMASTDHHWDLPASDHRPGIDDVALLLHTSGTTSRPKAVPLTHGNLSASLTNIIATYQLQPSDRSLLVMPLFHVHGLMAGEKDSLTWQRICLHVSMVDHPQVSLVGPPHKVLQSWPSTTASRQICCMGLQQQSHLPACRTLVLENLWLRHVELWQMLWPEFAASSHVPSTEMSCVL